MNTLAQATSWKDFNSHLKEEGVSMEIVMRIKDSRDMKDMQDIRFTKDGLTFKASQLKRGMTFAKMDAIIRRNAEKEQQAKAYNQTQSTYYELPNQDAAPEQQKHAESSISIPSLDLFDTNNPVYDPAEEEFRKECKRRKRSEGRDCKCLSFGTPCKLLEHSFQCFIVKDCNKTHRNSLFLHYFR